MFPTGSIMVPLGQLLGIAFACGLNLYITVALLGLGSRLGWIGTLPVSLRGLESGLVIGGAAFLYLVEFVADKIPYVDSSWDAVHTLIRPSAAALLALLALAPLDWPLQIAGAFAAGAAALASHGVKAGLRVVLVRAQRPALRILISLAEDALAIALAVASLVHPSASFAIIAAATLLLFAIGPRLWRAGFLGIRALAARLRGFFGSHGWRHHDDLPAALRGLVHVDQLGLAPPRVTRAAVSGRSNAGAYRNGWLVIESGAPAFLYTSLLRPRRLDLPTPDFAHIRAGLLADIIELESGSGKLTLFLLKDGPPLELAVAELVPRRP